jgi:gamma-D-glutamyl-L-lysine dipeptidyl-peptidase
MNSPVVNRTCFSRPRSTRVLFTLFTLFTFLLSVGVLAQTPPTAHIRVPVANMFSSASVDVDVVSQAIYGSDITVLERKDGFTQARTSDGYTGWMRDQDLLLSPDPYPSNRATVQIRSLSANLYREPDPTKHAPVLTIPFETRLEVIPQPLPENQDYLQIRLVDGGVAWLDRGDVEAKPHSLTIPESIELAKRFLGITYTWGGRSSFGFDCSGFTQMLVRSRGITMPRDADQQAAWSGVMPVDRRHLRPGDLLFFGRSSTNITHTGMYIGKHQFIHDTTNGQPGVQISRIDRQPWTKLLVAARRIK